MSKFSVLFLRCCLLLIATGLNGQSPANWEQIISGIKTPVSAIDSLNIWSKEEADGDFNLAEKINARTFELLKKTSYPSGEATAWKIRGIILDQKSNYGEAIQAYLRSIHLYKELKDELGAARCEGNIGIIFIHSEKFRESIAYLRPALRVFEQKEFKPGIGVVKENLGLAYLYLDNADSALYFLREAEKIFEGNPSKETTVWLNIGLVYSKLNMPQKAIAYLEKSVALYKEMNENDPGIFTVYLNLANEYQTIGENKKAVETGLLAAEGFKKFGMAETREYAYLCDALGEAYFALGDYKNAAESYETLAEVRKTVYNSNNLQQINELKSQYEDEKKQLEIKSLNSEKLRQSQNLENETKRKNIFLGALVLTLVLLGGLLFLVLQKIKDKKLILTQKKELELRNMVVEQKQKEVLDSIYYAHRIQRALMASERYIEKNLKILNRR